MSLQFLIPEWPAPPGVRALATGRAGGVSIGRYASLNLAAHVGDAAEAVAENRARLRGEAALPAEPCWLEQVHGARILDLDALSAGHAGPADGALTRQPDRVCAILSADCLPVLFASRSGEAVAAAHAGWRGLAAGVLEATVRALNVPPASLVAWLGPAIGPAHFEVGPEVRAAFLARHAESAAAFVENARGRYQADLYRLARELLERTGVRSVYGGGACTYADATRYFSHRRDAPTGRQATLIWRAPRG